MHSWLFFCRLICFIKNNFDIGTLPASGHLLTLMLLKLPSVILSITLYRLLVLYCSYITQWLLKNKIKWLTNHHEEKRWFTNYIVLPHDMFLPMLSHFSITQINLMANTDLGILKILWMTGGGSVPTNATFWHYMSLSLNSGQDLKTSHQQQN